MSSVDIPRLGFERVVSDAPVSIVVVDAFGSVVFSNRRARELTASLGREMPADLDRAIDIFHPDGSRYERDAWPAMRSLTYGEQITDEEFFYAQPNGERLWIHCSCSPVRDQDGKIVAAVLTQTEITERKREHARLGHLAGLLDNTDDAVVALDSEWYVTVWNKGAERMYGWTAEEVVGRHTLEVAQLDMSYEQRAEARAAAAELGRWRGDVVAHRKDGTRVPVEVITVALRDPEGEPTGFLGIHRDISERKRAEEALLDSQRRCETILESISDAFVAWDREWRYTYVNERALSRLEAWTGRKLTREEVVGKYSWELFPDAVGTEVERRLREAMQSREPVEFELYFPPTDEWVETRAFPSSEGLSVYYRSITERKRADEERSSRERREALLADLGLRALATDELQPLLDEAVGLVADTLDVELASVAEVLPGRERMLLRAGVGWQKAVVGQRAAIPGVESLITHTIDSTAPVVSEDLVGDQRFEISALLSREGVMSSATVVIAGRDAPFGGLGAFSRQRRSFSKQDLNFLQSVANVLATAVERSQTEQKLHAARQAERRRIARDLHDEALQELTDALTLAKGPLVPKLKRIGQQLRGAIYDLRLEEKDDQPFAYLLEAVVALHAAMAVACDVALDIRGDIKTGPLGRRGSELLRIVGEALTNARRHAGADDVRVRAWTSNGCLCVEISDDGRGFDPDDTALWTRGSGITGMRERARLLDARLEITSHPGSGTRVRIELPVIERGDGAVRILLVEDHAAVRDAIAAMFEREPEFEVVGQAASLAEARGLLDDVDIAVIDLGLPDGYGGDLIRELREVNPNAQALVLSASLDHEGLARAVESGASAALDKTAHLDEVVQALRRLRAGETVLPPDEVVELLRFAGRRREREYEDRQAISQLTGREREVLQALADGLDSQGIADKLGISVRTERNHVSSILGKLGVHSQLQALVFALRYDVVAIR